MSSLIASEYDKDELVPPEWLNYDFFERVLQSQNSGENIQITNIEIQPATKKGEHYASAMFRIKVMFTLSADCDVKSFIVKALPELEGEKQRLLENSKLFETEIGVYTNVLPRLVEVLRLAGECIRFGAEYVFAFITTYVCNFRYLFISQLPLSCSYAIQVIGF